jgi:hypothetical protein
MYTCMCFLARSHVRRSFMRARGIARPLTLCVRHLQMAVLALVHMIARGVHLAAYIVNLSTVRMMAYTVGIVSNVALFLLLVDRM